MTALIACLGAHSTSYLLVLSYSRQSLPSHLFSLSPIPYIASEEICLYLLHSRSVSLFLKSFQDRSLSFVHNNHYSALVKQTQWRQTPLLSLQTDSLLRQLQHLPLHQRTVHMPTTVTLPYLLPLRTHLPSPPPLRPTSPHPANTPTAQPPLGQYVPSAQLNQQNLQPPT